jgi:hypothetical protein
MIVYAGIPPGASGTGQFVDWLQRQGAAVVHSAQYRQAPSELIRTGRLLTALREVITAWLVRTLFRLRFRLGSLRDDHDAVLLHPQTIGLRRTLDFIRRRRRAPVMFLLDSSFFCIRSYNHLPGTTAPCLDCLGGRFESIDEHGCTPFPVSDPEARNFVRELRELIRAGRLHLVAQCATQARMAAHHFGVDVPRVGLWTTEWSGIFDTPAQPAVPTDERRADVVFHGFWVEAKGARWVVEVARHAPTLHFLMPFPRPLALDDAPPNCKFSPMTWDSGLAVAAVAADVVLVPSLWSAPVESAVVKSIAVASAVAVVDNTTAFVSDIPSDVILRLPADPELAAVRLVASVTAGWRPDPEARATWLARWRTANEPVLDSLSNAVACFASGDADLSMELDASSEAEPPGSGR